MKNKLFILITLLVALANVSNVNAANFVCGKDLNNNGDVLDEGEQASCQTIDNEQFCSIGAQSCNASQTVEYQCSIDNKKYTDENSCKSACKTTQNTKKEIIVYDDDNYYRRFVMVIGTQFGVADFITQGVVPSNHQHPVNTDNYYIVDSIFSTANQNSVKIGNKKGQVMYMIDTTVGGGAPAFILEFYEIIKETTGEEVVNGSCTISNQTTYSCPTAGNSCLNNNGIMQCSPNKCIDIDVDKPIEVNPPALTTIDDGTRDGNGACMDQSSLFAGRNLSCAYKGITKNCCKDKGIVFRDSSGSSLSNLATKTVMKQTFSAMSAAYSTYADVYGFFGDAGFAAGAAGDAAQSAFTGIDPYSIAISVAIQVVTEFISCGQQDAEAVMLNGSGYCHYVGDYCSKKWAFGCVKKSKSYCCFNSKMARIIQQQGRPQLGMNWGSSESPNCSGLTPQQFQKLDFSKIDMSEYYNDIQSKADSLIKKSVTDSVDKYYKQIGFDYADE